jgi:hypothetical protein
MAHAAAANDEPRLACLELPLTVTRATSKTGTAVMAIVVVMAGGLVLSPFGLVAALAANDPGSFMAVARHPATAIQLVIGLAVILAFIGLPLHRLLRQTRIPKHITITQRCVSASAQKLDQTPLWSEPVGAYRGVMHRVRTTFSGTHHELVLVHAEPSKTVVLQRAPRIAQSQIDNIAALLNLSEYKPRAT